MKNKDNQNIIVLKIGGSVLSPTTKKLVNTDFIKSFYKKILIPLTRQKYKFAITVGGGSIARLIISKLKNENVSNEYLHRTGIISSLLNATIFQSLTSKICNDHIVSLDDYLKLYKFVNIKTSFDKKPVVISCGGNRQTSSTDTDAVLFAMRFEVKKVISIKGIDGIYNKNPKTNNNAILIPKLKWAEYQEIIGKSNSHKPGDNWPIDPVATRMCIENDIQFNVIGNDIDNIYKCLTNQNFKGTVVY